MAKEDDGNKHDEQAMQSSLKVSVFSRPKMFDICIQKVRQNILNLFGKFDEYYNFE